MAKFRFSKVFGNATRATPVTVRGQLKGPKKNTPRGATKSSIGESYRSGSIQREQPGKPRQPGKIKAARPKFPPDCINGFEFDPYPPKVANGWLTPSDRLENPALQPTDAQRHIIELGRRSIARHGTADAALQALQAALNEHRELRRTAWARFRENSHGTWSQSMQYWHKISCAPGHTLSESQQRVGILEVAYEMSEGAGKLTKLLRVKESLSGLSANEYLYPFQQFFAYQNYLTQLLWLIPLRSVQQFAFSYATLRGEVSPLLRHLMYTQEVIHSPSGYMRRHALAKYRSIAVTQAIRASAASLLEHCDLSTLPRNTRTAVKDYKLTLGECKTTYDRAGQILFLVELRKQARSYGPQQNIYNTLHHHFKFVRRKQEHVILQFWREKNCLHFSQYRNKMFIFSVLRRLEDSLSVIMRIYYEDVKPLWSTRIQTMSSCELARQDRIAQKYWLTCSRSNDESASRMRELQAMGERARYAARGPSKYLAQRLQEDMVRLSEIHASYQKPAEPCVSLPLDVSPSNRGSTTGEGYDLSQPGKVVLWQPVRRAIEETSRPVSVAFSGAHAGANGRQTPDLNGSAVVSQVMRSGGTVSKCSASNPKTLLDGEEEKDPVLRVFTSFQSTHTTEKLVAEHKTIEAAMKALVEGYEKVVTFQAARKTSIQLLDHLTALRNLTAVYHGQKVQLASIAYHRAQGFAKPVASQHLLNCASELAIEQQMRPFQRNLDFLRWAAYISGPSSPFQALRGFGQQFAVLYGDSNNLVIGLSSNRAFFALEDGFKKRYATINYALSILIWKTLNTNDFIQRLIKRHTFKKATYLYPPLQEEMLNRIGIDRHMLIALMKIKLRRASVGDHQQSIFGCLDYQFSLFKSRSARIVVQMKKLLGSSYKSHFQEIESLVSAILCQYRGDIQNLWERHITLMSPQMLERYSQMARRFWSTRVTQFTPEHASEQGSPGEIYRLTSCIRKGHLSFAFGRKTKRKSGQALQLSAENRERHEQAIKAMQRLEEICPSRPPMSEQAFRKILELEDLQDNEPGTELGGKASVKSGGSGVEFNSWTTSQKSGSDVES